MVFAMVSLTAGLALVAYITFSSREDEPKKIRVKIDDRNDRTPR